MSAPGTGISTYSISLAAAAAAHSRSIFTHNVGKKAKKIVVTDTVTGRVLSDNDVQITQTVNAITISNLAGSAVVLDVEATFTYDSTQDNAIASTDARLSLATGPTAIDIVITVPGVYTIIPPSGAKAGRFQLIAGGGGGGGGRCGAAGGIRRGGGGGGGGGASTATLPVSVLNPVGETLTVGAGGTAGAGKPTTNDGDPGVAGADTTFGTWLTAKGGALGGAGTAVAGAGGAGGAGIDAGAAGGGSAAGAIGVAGTGRAATLVGGDGGGGGGSIDAANATYNGGAGGATTVVAAIAGGAGAVTDVSIATAGAVLAANAPYGGGGGGGGAGSNNAAPVGTQVGGAGGNYGGGGGGGGAGLNGTNSSGAGGAGAGGMAFITWFF